MMKTLSFIIATLLCINTLAQDQLFHGGFSDGYSSSLLMNPEVTISLGGKNDGYVLYYLENSSVIGSTGGLADGYSIIDFENKMQQISLGGFHDGYSRIFWIKKFWSGDVSFEWNEPDNWSDGIIPNPIDDVIIPAGRPYYPTLNNYVLKIGTSGSTNDYFCSSLWIQQDAQLTGNNQARLENYNLLIVDGQLFWKNTNVNAFQNFPNARIELKSQGELSIRN